MARYNKFQALITLLALLGIVAGGGFMAYNFTRYYLLKIKEENIRLEIGRQKEAIEKLPRFKQDYPTGIDYKKPLTKIAKKPPKPVSVPKPKAAPPKPPSSVAKPKPTAPAPPSKPKPKEAPSYKLMKCWKCKKPFNAPKGAKKGKCPHCGTEWALK